MFEGWRRFLALPDAVRAKFLIRVAAGMVILVLYALGGLSLHLRSRYLGPVTPTPSQQAAATEPAEQEPTVTRPAVTAAATQAAATQTPGLPTATLFPTLTLAVEQPTVAPTMTSLPPTAVVGSSETPFPSPTPQPTATPLSPTPTETEPPATATPTPQPLGPPPTRMGT